MKCTQKQRAHAHTHTHGQHNTANQPIVVSKQGRKEGRKASDKIQGHLFEKTGNEAPNYKRRDCCCFPIRLGVSSQPSLTDRVQQSKVKTSTAQDKTGIIRHIAESDCTDSERETESDCTQTRIQTERERERERHHTSRNECQSKTNEVRGVDTNTTSVTKRQARAISSILV